MTPTCVVPVASRREPARAGRRSPPSRRRVATAWTASAVRARPSGGARSVAASRTRSEPSPAPSSSSSPARATDDGRRSTRPPRARARIQRPDDRRRRGCRPRRLATRRRRWRHRSRAVVLPPRSPERRGRRGGTRSTSPEPSTTIGVERQRTGRGVDHADRGRARAAGPTSMPIASRRPSGDAASTGKRSPAPTAGKGRTERSGVEVVWAQPPGLVGEVRRLAVGHHDAAGAPCRPGSGGHRGTARRR